MQAKKSVELLAAVDDPVDAVLVDESVGAAPQPLRAKAAAATKTAALAYFFTC
jgi:hypothetical protein